jgi:hypothetical protein
MVDVVKRCGAHRNNIDGIEKMVMRQVMNAIGVSGY